MADGSTGGRARLFGRLLAAGSAAMWAVVCAGQPMSSGDRQPKQGDFSAAEAVAVSPPANDAREPLTANGTQRLVRLYQFDDVNNPDPVPPGWERTTLTAEGKPRAGFPRFNLAVIDSRQAVSGARSLYLPTRGGCAALRLRGGEAPVFADADYAVTARVRTNELEYARAFITVRLLDQRLQPIAGSERRSDPLASQGMWSTATVQVPGGSGAAAWIQIDLELLQPQQFAPPVGDDPASQALERHRLYREDVRGGAWFDDVAVLQIPRANISTASPGNIVQGDETPSLQVSVRDLGGEALRARVRVFDIRGRRVDQILEPINPDGRVRQFPPRLPGRGWYAARLDVLGAGGGDDAPPVSSAHVQFVWLPMPVGTGAPGLAVDLPNSKAATIRARTAALVERDQARFGLIADDLPDARADDLAVLTSRIGTRFIYLPAWRSDTTLAESGPSLAQRRSAIEALLRQGQSLTFVLDGVPNELSRNTLAPVDDALSLAAIDPNAWMSYLTPTLNIFGQRVLRYQLGRTGVDHAFWKKDLAQEVQAMEGAIATLVPGPLITVPWSADRVLPSLARPSSAAQPTTPSAPTPAVAPATPAGAEGGDGSAPTSPTMIAPAAPLMLSPQTGTLVDALTVWYPAGFPASEVGPVLKSLTSPDTPQRELTVVFDLPPRDAYGIPAGIIELMRRAVEMWAAQGGRAVDPRIEATETGLSNTRIALRQPWTWSGESLPQIMPRPELASLVVLRDRLSGRRVVGELTNVSGVKCYILAARNTALGTLERGALIAWNESADPARAIVDAAAIGSAVTVVDAFGNQTSIPVMASEAAGGAGGAGGTGGTGPSPLVTVPIGETPVFIEGIDPYLALFAASFRLEPSFMPAVVREHEHQIILTNPWPMRITGKLQLKEDTEAGDRSRRTVTSEWRVSPSGIIDFDMAPGQTSAIPVTLSFGAGQLAGIKDFVIVARAVADRPYPPIRVHAPVEIGLEDIEMDPELQITPGDDVVVVAAVTNKGTRPRTLRLESAARNVPSQQLQISDLPPGQTVLRRFVFKDAAKELSGRRVVISLSDLEEAQRLNKAVAVP